LSVRDSRRGKRRREDDDADNSSASDVDRSPGRKRNGTGSGLKKVKNIDSERESEATDTPTAGTTDEQIRREQREVEEAEEREEAAVEDSDDELARELERELEEYDG
jgi:hypothetical protein